jgi:thioredoxin 1
LRHATSTDRISDLIPEGVGEIQPPLVTHKEFVMAQSTPVTSQEITTALSKGPTIVDFWAPWCKPCVAINAELEKIASFRKDVTVIKVNVDENPAIVQEYGIKSVPYVLYTSIANGSPKAFAGFLTAEDLLRRMMLDPEAVSERQFLRSINPDPVTAMAKASKAR